MQLRFFACVILSLSLSVVPTYAYDSEEETSSSCWGPLWAEIKEYYQETSQSVNSFIEEKKLFLSKFLQDHKTIGAIAPSSRYLAKAMTKHLKKYKKPIHILEVGAGTGIVTEYIKKYMPEGSTLHVVEIDKGFYKMLEERFRTNGNVKIYCCSITDLELHDKVDCIISGLPFHSFSPGFVQQILDKYSRDFIKPNGVITFFEYAFLPTLKKMVVRKDSDYRAVLDTLEAFRNEKPNKKEEMVMLNIPPARVITCSGIDLTAVQVIS